MSEKLRGQTAAVKVILEHLWKKAHLKNILQPVRRKLNLFKMTVQTRVKLKL